MSDRRNNREAYKLFLKSKFWIELSSAKKDSVGNKCERCPCTEFLQCHHIKYESDWFSTKMEDLIVLCKFCHKKEHGIVSNPRKRKKKNSFSSKLKSWKDFKAFGRYGSWAYSLRGRSFY